MQSMFKASRDGFQLIEVHRLRDSRTAVPPMGIINSIHALATASILHMRHTMEAESVGQARC